MEIHDNFAKFYEANKLNAKSVGVERRIHIYTRMKWMCDSYQCKWQTSISLNIIVLSSISFFTSFFFSNA